MSLDAERNENMGRPKGSVSIYDDGPRSARCETCGFCALSEAVMTASGEGRNGTRACAAPTSCTPRRGSRGATTGRRDMRAESLDRRGGYVLECRQCGRRFRAANRNQRYCCGWCENVAHRNESKRPVDVYLGTRSESGREVNAMRAALAQGRRI